MSSTRFLRTASEAARLMAVVVLPTPPFWLAIAIVLPIDVFKIVPQEFLGCKGTNFSAKVAQNHR
jgi:hypothetical protein